MKISTRGRYGLKAIIEIASQEPTKSVNLKSISKRQGISENYLEQLMSPLKKAGFIDSIRGSRGGYILSVPPEDITVGDILRVLEGSISPVGCLDGDIEYSCGESNCANCVTKPVWEKIYTKLTDVVDSISIKELADNYKKLEIH